jgi:hypothetical protein
LALYPMPLLREPNSLHNRLIIQYKNEPNSDRMGL